MPVSDWKTTASLNLTVGGINIAENAPRANMNDAIRAVMAEAKAEFDRIATYRITPEYFGAVGNGASSTADSAAFAAFNAWAIALPAGSLVELTLARGADYRVADPRWPMNIPFLTVYGNNAKIQSSGTVNTLKMLILPCYPLYSLVNATPVYGVVTRSLINTVAAGSTTIQLKTIAEALNYTVGQSLMVASWVKQWEGHAPSYRLFEYPIISAINTGTGTITTDRPLTLTHLETNPYLTPNDYAEGRAHIEKIDQASLWGIRHRYYNIRFVKNAVSAAGAIIEGVYQCGRDISFIDCEAPYFLTLVAETAYRERCLMTEAGEWDKVVKTYTGLNNVYKGAMTSATSVDYLKETGTEFRAGYILNPKALELIDCRVTAASQTAVQVFNSYGFMERLKITGGAHQFYPSYSIVSSQTTSITEGAAGVTWAAATSSLTLDFSTLNGPAQLFLAQAYPGARILVTVDSGGESKPNGVYGIVETVTGTANGIAVLKINFNGSPVAAKLTIFPEPWVTDINGERDYVNTVKTNYTLKDVVLTTGYSVQNINAFGQVTSFKCDVVRAYTGATAGNILLDVYDTYPVNLQFRKLVDIKTLGTRQSTQLANAGFTGAAGESAGANLSTASFGSRVSSRINIVASTMASANPTELPVVNVYLQLECPLGIRP